MINAPRTNNDMVEEESGSPIFVVASLNENDVVSEGAETGASAGAG